MRISDWSSDVCSSDPAVITQVTPIDVVFNVPQDPVGEIRALADQRVLPAVALDRTRTTALATGTFLTPDNQADANPGTELAKAPKTEQSTVWKEQCHQSKSHWSQHN